MTPVSRIFGVVATAFLILFTVQQVRAQGVEPGEEFVAPMMQVGIPQAEAAPDRPDGEGAGPYDRLIIRGVTLIDGTGAPPQGPIDLVI